MWHMQLIHKNHHSPSIFFTTNHQTSNSNTACQGTDPKKTTTGWWYTYPSEKYESRLGLLFPIYGKIKFTFQTTNHQPIMVFCKGSWIWDVNRGASAASRQPAELSASPSENFFRAPIHKAVNKPILQLTGAKRRE